MSLTVKPETARELKRIIQTRPMPQNGNPSTFGQRQIIWVRITSQKDSDVDWYGVITIYDSNASTWIDYDTVTVIGANGQSLNIGTRYACFCHGYGFYIAVDTGGNDVQWIKITSLTTDGDGCYPGLIRTYSDYAFADSDTAVKVVLAEGETFIVDKVYMGIYETTISGTDIYSCSGNVINIVQTCGTGGVPQCDSWYMAAPFTIVSNVDCTTGYPSSSSSGTSLGMLGDDKPLDEDYQRAMGVSEENIQAIKEANANQ